jgi:ribosomal protein S18 acetylase RimI-like enzyme
VCLFLCRRDAQEQAGLSSARSSKRQKVYPACLLLKVATTQNAARRLYESLGFRVFGTQPHSMNIGDRYIDEYYMLLEFGSEPP